MSQRITVQQILQKKVNQQKIVMLTAYDYAMATFVDSCDIDIILVGDSVANVVLGLASTRDVTMDMMLHHTKAVNRAVKNALLVGDMPYEAYQTDSDAAVKNARRFMEEAGCGAVKIEWFDNCLEVVEKLIQTGIPVMGHVGLTPQTAEQMGGFKVQGKDSEAAERIMSQARALEEKGCFSIVLECIPDRIAEMITNNLAIPTIGIGAGAACDGQVLVVHDLLGLFESFRPKFVKQYVAVGELIKQGVRQFQTEVREGKFPGKDHNFSIRDEEIQKIRNPSTKP